MTARVVLTTDTMRDVLWVPAQAVFESDGRSFVYVQSAAAVLFPPTSKWCGAAKARWSSQA